MALTSAYAGLTYSPDDIRETGTLVLRSSNVQGGEIVDADNVYVDKEVVNTNNVQLDDVIVVVRNGSRDLIGKHALIRSDMKDTVVGAFMTGLRGNGVFVNALLDTSQFGDEIRKSLGATINQITGRDFSMMKFKVPETAERTQIGVFFQQLDGLIAANQRKVDQLQRLKRAYLQQLFPVLGQAMPRLRFLGFNGIWDECKLGELVEFTKGSGYSKSDLVTTGYPIILYGRLYTNHELAITKVDDTFVSHDKGSVKSVIGDVIIPCSGETSKDIARASAVLLDNVILGGDLNILRPNCELLDSLFLTITLSSGSQAKLLANKAQGKSVVHLHKKDLQSLQVRYPPLPEQSRISGLIRSLDYVIADWAVRVEQLENLKDGYLQKMFA